MTSCIFCQIIFGELPSFKVYEDEFTMAILDIYPITPGHVLIFPKKHFTDYGEIDEQSGVSVFNLMRKVYQSLKILTPHAIGFNILQNNGRGAGQEITHVHFHIIPRYNDDHI